MSTTTRLSSRVAAALITERSALATRPPRPITRPRSSSATSSSRTTSPSISSASVTWTASGSATRARARNSSSSRIPALTAYGLDALDPQQRRDRPGGRRARREPVAGAILVDHDQRGIRLRVVLPDRLDRPAVPRRSLVGDHDTPDRVLLAANPAESDSHGHAAAEVRGCAVRTRSGAAALILVSAFPA